MRRLSLVSLPIVLLVLSCGKAPKTFDALDVVSRGPVQTRTQTLNAATAASEALLFRREWVAFAVAAGIHAKEQPPALLVEPSSVVPPLDLTTVPAATSSNCGGDLPPCYVMQRESGGSYNAYNPTGCGGAGCYGKWQFSGAWAGKLGLPDDLATATPEQQDNAARELWAGGAGASNWGVG